MCRHYDWNNIASNKNSASLKFKKKYILGVGFRFIIYITIYNIPILDI